MRVLESYFDTAGTVTAENAWEHVYKCLLWIDEATRLAHIYDSNHMRPGGFFNSRAIKFTEALCREWGTTKQALPGLVDRLFKGCVEAWRARRHSEVENENDEEGQDIENEFHTSIFSLLTAEGIAADRADALARRFKELSRDYFTIGNKRKNALGEGFEDLLFMLLKRVAGVPEGNVMLRTPVSKLPGFRKALPRLKGQRRQREPSPDIALCDADITHVIVTAKWSIRQDRETQFQSEFNAYQRNKVQSTELRFALITNEFDVARLDNIARAIPTGQGGYIFHTIYHINPDLLQETQGAKLGALKHWIGAGKILSLADFLQLARQEFSAG